MNKLWYIHTMGYYRTKEMSKLRLHTTTWMNLTSMMLTARSHAQKHTIWFYVHTVY